MLSSMAFASSLSMADLLGEVKLQLGQRVLVPIEGLPPGRIALTRPIGIERPIIVKDHRLVELFLAAKAMVDAEKDGRDDMAVWQLIARDPLLVIRLKPATPPKDIATRHRLAGLVENVEAHDVAGVEA